VKAIACNLIEHRQESGMWGRIPLEGTTK